MAGYFVNNVYHLESCSPSQWIIDTGSTDHVTPFINLLQDPEPCNATLQLSNGDTAQITHVGSLWISLVIQLTNVLCVPTFYYNLLSISKLVQGTNSQVNFVDGKCYLQNKKKNLSLVVQ